MDVDDGGRLNIVHNTYNGKAWSRFAKKQSENTHIGIYISHN